VETGIGQLRASIFENVPVFQKQTWEMKLNNLYTEYFSNQLKGSITKEIIMEIFFSKDLNHYCCSLVLK